jgi:hypothetical protein
MCMCVWLAPLVTHVPWKYEFREVVLDHCFQRGSIGSLFSRCAETAHVRVCMRVCMYVCMYVSLKQFSHCARTAHVCVYVCMCVCIHVLYVCIHVLYVCMYVRMHACMYMNVCMYTTSKALCTCISFDLRIKFNGGITTRPSCWSCSMTSFFGLARDFIDFIDATAALRMVTVVAIVPPAARTHDSHLKAEGRLCRGPNSCSRFPWLRSQGYDPHAAIHIHKWCMYKNSMRTYCKSCATSVSFSPPWFAEQQYIICMYVSIYEDLHR